MVYCSKCGKKNEDDAEFCTKCGHALGSISDEAPLDERIEEAAESFGKRIEAAGKRFEHRMNAGGKRLEDWYVQRFGIAGPLISSVIFLIILRIVIEVMIRTVDAVSIFDPLSIFLLDYFLFIFGLSLLSSYNTYFHRRYKKQFQWVFPIFTALGATGCIWFLAQLLYLLVNNTRVFDFAEPIADFIELYIIAIFIVILLIGYLYVLFRFSIEKNDTK